LHRELHPASPQSGGKSGVIKHKKGQLLQGEVGGKQQEKGQRRGLNDQWGGSFLRKGRVITKMRVQPGKGQLLGVKVK